MEMTLESGLSLNDTRAQAKTQIRDCCVPAKDFVLGTRKMVSVDELVGFLETYGVTVTFT